MRCRHHFDPTCRVCLQRKDIVPPSIGPPPKEGICVYMNANGIGDFLLGTTAVSGLRKDYPDLPIYYSCKKGLEVWGELFPDFITVNVPPKGTRQFDPNANYREEMTLHNERWLRYARACRTTPQMPHVRITEDSLKFGSQYTGSIVLAPFSSHKARTWHIKHYLHLADILTQRGERVVVIDDQRIRCNNFSCEKVLGQSPMNVAGLLKHAKYVIGNDSAMCHLAGILDVPAIVLIAQIDGTKIFGFYKSVKILQAEMPCTRCYFSGPSFTVECRTNCVNLNAIRADDVVSYMARVPLPRYC